MLEARPRQIAYRALRRGGSSIDFVEHRLDTDPGFGALAPPDRRLAQELVFGVLRQREVLDWLIRRRTNGRPQEPALQDLLRLGLYQLFFLDRVPAHAAVNETVQLAREAGFGPKSGFVNAVLRGCDRDRALLQAELASLRATDPATAWSHPAWLVERWRQRHGDDGLRQLLNWDNTPPPTYARVNTLRTDAARLRERWVAEGVVAEPFERDWIGADLAFKLASHPPLAGLPSFQDGCFYIQDPSTLLAVRLLDPHPGERILDLCAAPGGKTSFIAQLLGNHGTVVAHDAQPGRLALLHDNCRRLGITCAEITSDSAALGLPGTLDRILVDAPCSNTGVLRRRLEARWRLKPEDLPRLQAGQLALLRRASAWLRPGGTLVHSTCSLEPEENAEVVAAFLATEPGFVLGSQRETGPLADGVDGAFAAALIRNG